MNNRDLNINVFKRKADMSRHLDPVNIREKTASFNLIKVVEHIIDVSRLPINVPFST